MRPSIRRSSFSVHIVSRTILLMLIFVYCFGFMPPPVVADEVIPAAPGSISGRVTNEDGEPLPETPVWLYSFNGFQPLSYTLTNQAGAYQFTGLPPGIYKLEFNGAGYIFESDYAFRFYAGASTIEQATEILVMENNVTGINGVLPPGGVISGTVAFAGPWPEYSEIFLELQRRHINGQWDAYLSRFVSRHDSSYSFLGLATGSYRLCAANYFDANRECDIVPVIAGQITANHNLTVTLSPGVGPLLGGRVVDDEGNPLTDIVIELWTEYAVDEWEIRNYSITDAAGRYGFAYTFPGRYILAAQDPEGEYLRQFYSLTDAWAEAEVLTIPPDQNIRYEELDFQLRRAGQIRGLLSFVDGLSPVYGGQIFVEMEQDGSWDAMPSVPIVLELMDGGYPYELKGLSAGRYRVRVEGWYNFGVPFSAYYGGDTEDEAAIIVLGEGEIRDDVDLTIGVGDFEGVVSGTVTVDGAPRAGIRVELSAEPTQYAQMPAVYTITDAEGAYRFTGLARGVYVLGFFDPAGELGAVYYGNGIQRFAATPFTLDKGEIKPGMDMEMKPGGALSGRIYNQDNSPAEDAQIRLIYVGEEDWWELSWPDYVAQLDEQGGYRFAGLQPGPYRIAASSLDRPGELVVYTGTSALVFDDFGKGADIIVSAGEETGDIDIRLVPRQSVPSVYLPAIAIEAE